MERQKGELLLSWQKKPVGVYFGDYKIYSFDSFEIVDYLQRPKEFKALFYAESLSGANLRNVNLFGANLSGANLEGANLSRAYLRGADLEGANLYGVNLRNANLGGANLYSANLSGANLTGAYLYGANLKGAGLTNIKYDKITVWPEGFKP